MGFGQSFVGTVVKLVDDIATVRVQRHRVHPQIEKLITYYKKFFCTNDVVKAEIGDKVVIGSIQPINKQTYFQINNVLEQGKRYTDPITGKTITYLPKGYYPRKPRLRRQTK